jgi:hypothetical protein
LRSKDKEAKMSLKRKQTDTAVVQQKLGGLQKLESAVGIMAQYFGAANQALPQMTLGGREYKDDEKMWRDIWLAWEGDHYAQREILLEGLMTAGPDLMSFFPVMEYEDMLTKYQIRHKGERAYFDKWEFGTSRLDEVGQRAPGKLNKTERSRRSQTFEHFGNNFEVPLNWITDEKFVNEYAQYIRQVEENVKLTWQFQIIQTLMSQAREYKKSQMLLNPIPMEEIGHHLCAYWDIVGGLQKNGQGFTGMENRVVQNGLTRNVKFDTVLTASGTSHFLYAQRHFSHMEHGNNCHPEERRTDIDTSGSVALTHLHGLRVAESRRFANPEMTSFDDPMVEKMYISQMFRMLPGIVEEECSSKYTTRNRHIGIVDADTFHNEEISLRDAFTNAGLFDCNNEDDVDEKFTPSELFKSMKEALHMYDPNSENEDGFSSLGHTYKQLGILQQVQKVIGHHDKKNRKMKVSTNGDVKVVNPVNTEDIITFENTRILDKEETDMLDWYKENPHFPEFQENIFSDEIDHIRKSILQLEGVFQYVHIVLFQPSGQHLPKFQSKMWQIPQVFCKRHENIDVVTLYVPVTTNITTSTINKIPIIVPMNIVESQQNMVFRNLWIKLRYLNRSCAFGIANLSTGCADAVTYNFMNREDKFSLGKMNMKSAIPDPLTQEELDAWTLTNYERECGEYWNNVVEKQSFKIRFFDNSVLSKTQSHRKGSVVEADVIATFFAYRKNFLCENTLSTFEFGTVFETLCSSQQYRITPTLDMSMGDYDTWQYIMANNLPLPLGFLLFRMHMQVEVGSALFFKRGAETAIMCVKDVAVTFERDTSSYSLTAGIRLSSNIFVREPKNLEIVPHVFIKKYISGGGIVFYNASSPSHREVYSQSHMPTRDIFSVAVPYDYKITKPYLDITGHLSEAYTSNANNSTSMYPTAKQYKDYWGWTANEHELDLDRLCGQAPTNLSVCAQSSQYLFNPSTGRCDITLSGFCPMGPQASAHQWRIALSGDSMGYTGSGFEGSRPSAIKISN